MQDPDHAIVASVASCSAGKGSSAAMSVVCSIMSVVHKIVLTIIVVIVIAHVISVVIVVVTAVVVNIFIINDVSSSCIWTLACLPLSSTEVTELKSTATSATNQHVTHANTHRHSRNVVATEFEFNHVFALRAGLPFLLLCNTHKQFCTFVLWAQALVTVSLADNAGLSKAFSAGSHSRPDRFWWDPLGTGDIAAVSFVPSIMFFLFR
jgi:hypothetical protein